MWAGLASGSQFILSLGDSVAAIKYEILSRAT